MSSHKSAPVQSTAGAVPVTNKRGEVSMEKVKVHRYISGKRPDYAPPASSDEEFTAEFSEQQLPEKRQPILPQFIREKVTIKKDADSDVEKDDPRLRRLKAAHCSDDGHRKRYPLMAEIKSVAPKKITEPKIKLNSAIGSDSSDEDLDEDAVEKKRCLLRQKLLSEVEVENPVQMLKKEEEKVIPKPQSNVEDKNDDNGDDEDNSDDDDDDDDYSESEEEYGPRLKPVFVKAKDRVTIIEREKAANRQMQAEAESKREKEERRKETLKIVEESVRRDEQEILKLRGMPNIYDVCTDDENDEEEYEAWKLRELKRMKRDKEEREIWEKDNAEIKRYHNMTDEERRLEQRMNPKTVSNKPFKGKYKFLQKYYHRGAFYLDKEEDILKQDFSEPTLEDHFDKSVLPKVMQVKKFGRSGRTKYTHLVEQDTTKFDSPWCDDVLPPRSKFHFTAKPGCSTAFDKPSNKRKNEHE